MHCAKKSQYNKNRKKALSLPSADITADSMAWRRKMLHILGKAKIQETQLPAPSETQIPQGEYRKPVTDRHHGRMCYHSSSQSPQKVVVMWLAFHSLFSFFLSIFPGVSNRLFPSQLQTLT